MNEQLLCGKQAMTLAHWPGSDPLPVCTDHHSWMIQVAGALGLYVSTTQADPDATCNQIVKQAEEEQEAKNAQA